MPGEQWTREDRNFVFYNAAVMTGPQLSDRLGRSLKSVQNMAARLGVSIKTETASVHLASVLSTEGVPFRDSEGRVLIGARTLIAKTCLTCGRFHMARRYFRRGPDSNRPGHWYPSCISCTSAKNNEGRDDRNRCKGSERAAQIRTKPVAVNSQRQWTQEEDAIISDLSLSVEVAAIKVGRTFYATRTRAGALGVVRSLDPAVGKHWVLETRDEVKGIAVGWPQFRDLMETVENMQGPSPTGETKQEMIRRLAAAFDRAYEQWRIDHPGCPKFNGDDPYWTKLRIVV